MRKCKVGRHPAPYPRNFSHEATVLLPQLVNPLQRQLPLLPLRYFVLVDVL